MATATGTVGAKANIGGGSQADNSFTPDGALRATDAHGRYFDAVMRGNAYLAANQAGAALSNLSATCTGWCLTNPVNSGKWLSLLAAGLFQTSTAATTANAGVQLAFGAVSATAVIHTTPLVVLNLPLGSGTRGVGLVDSAATLPAAPTAVMNLWQPSVSATATTGIPGVIAWDFAGLITIAPGSSISFSALSALSAAVWGVWEEVLIPSGVTVA